MQTYFDDVREQPAALRRVADLLPAALSSVKPLAEKLQQGHFTHVVFTGMGSSLSACISATVLLAERSIPAIALETSELLYAYHSLLTDKTLLVVVSQSGQSVEIVKFIEGLQGVVTVIGVTNTADSPLAQHSTLVIPMHAGAEISVATKTYTCTVAALYLLTLALLGQPIEAASQQLRETADQLEQLMPTFEALAPQLRDYMQPVRFIEYLGRGVSRGSALTAALITKETAKLPTEGMAGGQFRHGPWEILTPEVTVCLFMGYPASYQLDLSLAADIVERGGKAVVIGPHAVGGAFHINVPALANPYFTLLLEIVPIQLLAAELATTQGIVPGKFRFGGKITVTE